MKYKNDHLKLIKDEVESNFNDFRDIDEEEMINHINRKVDELPIHSFLQELSLTELLWSYE